MADVGLTIVEGVANGASAYREPSKRNIGLLGQFVRGAAFTPTKTTNLEDFNTLFGGQCPSFYGPAIVKSIFDEAGNAPVTLYLARVVGSGSVAANGAATLSDNAVMQCTAGYKGKDDTGTWANGITVSLYSFGSKVRDMFTLVVRYGDAVENYNYATLSEIQTAVNKVSKYITIEFSNEITKLVFVNLNGTITTTTSSNEVNGNGTNFTNQLAVGNVIFNADGKIIGTVARINSATKLTLTSRAMVAVDAASAKKRDDVVYTATLAGGVDGDVVESDFYPIESTTDPKGLACFDGVDVQIIATTEYHCLTMAKVLNEYVKTRKNPIGVINLPLNADEGDAELYASELQTKATSFLAGAYMGWVKVPDENGNGILIPSIGPVLGAAYIRTPYLHGGFIHIPPGGVDSLFNNVLEVIPAHLGQNTINRLVQQFSCNYIAYIENTGYYVGSSRTYSTDSMYASIHVRMQTSYYLRALGMLMKFLEQKPNTPELKREALVTLNRFFKTEYDNGALERGVSFDTAYQGICDKSNNPPTQDRKILNIDVLWIPTECTESIRIALQRNDGILTSLETEV